MSKELIVLVTTAISIGFLHTIMGPDHYVPFVLLAKSKNWSYKKTSLVTLICGVGHVLSSVVLGFIAIGFGAVIFKINNIQSIRAEISGWLLLGFGVAYFVWGLRAAYRNELHQHKHSHVENYESHDHFHKHTGSHTHIHASENTNASPWILFTIFVFGPCETLIPILMYPAAKGSLFDVLIVVLAFSVVTISTMLASVLILQRSLKNIAGLKFRRYSHALAGLSIALCGGAIKFLGL